MREAPLAAVIGHPVAHSLSPLIFSLISARERTPVEYRKIDVAPEDFARFTWLARKLGLFAGWNVTIPHKQSAAKACDRLSPEARATGAVNVMRFEKKGRVAGFNTDILGIERTLAGQGVRLKGKRVVVFGAGGAGLAAGYAAGRMGAAEVVFVNRTLTRARAAARRLAKAWPRTRFRAAAWPGGQAAELYVNATSLGMRSSSAPPLPPGARSGAVAFDVVYVPEDTAFLRAARKRGLRAVGGLDMLVWQAIATWEIWFGKLGSGRAKSLKGALARALRAELARRARAKS